MLRGALAAAVVALSGRALARQARASFRGQKPGGERNVDGITFCWCPPGRFMMGSPPGEPERRPGEDQVEVTLTRGFWMAKYEATQGQWKRIVGDAAGRADGGVARGG